MSDTAEDHLAVGSHDEPPTSEFSHHATIKENRKEEEDGKRDKHRRSGKERHRHRHRVSNSTTAASAAVAPAGSSPSAAAEENWESNRAAIEQLCTTPPNNICADCREVGTRWASVNHGVFVCIRCSGIHRSLGVHISKVKSTNMDHWSAAEVRLMTSIGNAQAALLLEAQLPAGVRPTPIGGGAASSSSPSGSVEDAAMRTFIERKYVQLAFAVEDFRHVLRKAQRQAGYGQPQKAPVGSGGGDAGAAGTRGDERAPHSTVVSLRGDTVKALYGDAAASMVRATKRQPVKEQKVFTPLHGTFGVVTIPAEEHEARWNAMLTAFLGPKSLSELQSSSPPSA